MRKGLVVPLFIGISLIQVITPLSMIMKRESVLKNGGQFKFETAPVDPYDAFRGRYVALRIQEDKISIPKELKLNSGQAVYAAITVDERGFAKLVGVSVNRPVGEAYIKAKVKYVAGDKAYLELPFDRYYMEEKAAPAAERIYRRSAQRKNQESYIVVRIKDGFAVIENLYVGGQKIEDAVKQEK